MKGKESKAVPPRNRTQRAQRRVLVVEDEFLVAIHIEEMLQELGYATIGPFTTLEAALQASREQAFEFAVLDVNLGGQKVFPLADELLARALPFAFVTGYAAGDLPEAYRHQPRLQKPIDQAELSRALASACRQGRSD